MTVQVSPGKNHAVIPTEPPARPTLTNRPNPPHAEILGSIRKVSDRTPQENQTSGIFQ
ncbi:hypothetical protein NIES23_61140 (plasmid) [Trichormus variabilis NIES-23]|uniref:Uncharacterized protein n=1 Tax=Trichormus variabilis NIES-23 TaxID=1973479 RepID=A0A1Z4KWC9_ANAVA|nr:hypothetical protein NIES23_61140 [Trichormus variabilis NIES-23]